MASAEENNFLNIYPTFISDLYLARVIKQLFQSEMEKKQNWQSIIMGLFSSNKCEVCGSKDSASMNVFKILDHKSRPYTYDANVTYSSIPDGFSLAFSDVNIKSPHGTVYFYKLGNSNVFHHICSLQCAFNYSVKECALVIYKDPENDKILRGITPQTLIINKGLGIPEIAKYRGQPVSRKG